MAMTKKLPHLRTLGGLSLVSLAIVVACGQVRDEESAAQWVTSPGMSKS